MNELRWLFYYPIGIIIGGLTGFIFGNLFMEIYRYVQ